MKNQHLPDLTESVPSMLEAALEHANEGRAVFPVHTPRGEGKCSCDKACNSPGKHPRTPNGHKAATTDEAQIRAWWTAWPDANIGIATGAVSGLIVVDVDGVDGAASLQKLADEHESLPATRTVKTGNGRQLYFRHPGGKVRNAAPIRRDFPGLDSRGDGGYVVAPPSLHYRGCRYMLDETSEKEVAQAPAWLIAFINDRPPNAGGPLQLVVDHDRPAIAEGSRNSTLAALAGSMRLKGFNQAAIEAALLAHNAEQCQPPLDEEEVRAIARSISNYPPGSPSDVRRTLTDVGNSKRFARRYSQVLRYVPEWGKWIRWTGTHWEADAVGAVTEMAKTVVAEIYEEGNSLTDPELRLYIARHAKASAKAARLNAMLDLAASDPELVIRAEELDRHRGLLGVQNGTLDLSTGTLRPAVPEDYITMLAPVSFDAEAECPRFQDFLLEIMGGDRSLTEFLQRVVGYALSGYTSEQCLFFLFGTGANGKSTLLSALRDLLGPRYYLSMPSDALTVRPGKSGATPELARLAGARVVVSSELEDNSWLAESLVKDMTGGDRIAARHLFKEYFEFVPQFKLIIAGNHKPVIRNDDYGIWRRIHLVPFLVTITPEKRDPELPERLRDELPGILNWALIGYRQWRKCKLSPPPVVAEAVENYKQEMDILGQWIDECCEQGDGLETSATAAYTCFKGWSGFNGFRPWTQARFGRKVKERFGSRRPAAGTVYAGFRLKKEADLFCVRQ